MAKTNTTKCRNCGKSNLKIYEDGSGICLDCNDAFANINEYDQNKNEVGAVNSENIFSRSNKQTVVSKWKGPQQYVAMLTILYILFGLGFIAVGAWHLILSNIGSVFPSHIVTFLICGILFIISGLSLHDNGFKRASYFSIIIFMLLLFQGLYYIYNGFLKAVFDSACFCAIAFLLFIIFSAFLFLRLSKGVRK